jgi:amidohydrolase
VGSLDISTAKQRVCDEVDRLSGRLVEVSHRIHAQPELNYAEVFAHDLLTSVLEEASLRPQRSAFGVDTGFRADAGSSGTNVGVLLEYDALPEIGHACGHNIIAAAGLGAGLALASVATACGGRVAIIGTPAEEGGGGKIAMARRGAFDDLDAAMMIHPADADIVRMDTIAVQQMSVSFTGRAAHAAAAPEQGRNALDAAVLSYMNVAALRQHIDRSERLHGIFTRAGDKPNIVPHETEMLWYARSATIETLQPLKNRLAACMEAGAVATGCTCECAWEGHTYSDMRDNQPLLAAYVANISALGRVVQDPAAGGRRVVGSTDMGNVSYLVPSIHPMIGVAPEGVAIHTAEFARWAASSAGDAAVIDGAKALAMTAVDLWLDPVLLDGVRSAFGPGPDRSVLS